MVAALYCAAYLAGGLWIIRCLLPRRSVPERVWLGASFGLFLLMWLPVLCAFFGRFSVTGHLVALGLLALADAAAYLLRDRRTPLGLTDADVRLLKQAACVVLPLTLLSAWLQYTHVMRVAADGSWHVGQSTYGDLPMHLSFITGLKNAAFPADYPFFPGHRLSYPFLTDSLSTTFYLFGWSLQAATVIPAVLMMALCFFGVLVLGRNMTAGKRTALLAVLLFFLNGGLGFLYDFDLAGGWTTAADGSRSWTIVERIRAILTGYYTTPTNQPTPNNLRWSNVIADLMVPQRTLLGGWCMVLPCFSLLQSCFVPDRCRSLNDTAERPQLRGVILLGIWAGGLPLIHTHSFLALGLCSAGMLVYDMLLIPDKGRQLKRYLLYAGIAVLLALPQLLCFTFSQVFGAEDSNGSFLRLWFNWVNSSTGDANLKDLYLWFYIKNIGLPFLALIFALFEKNPMRRRLFAGALPIILAAELVRFQPNIYDNNKLLYLAWLLCCMIVADWCSEVWHKLRGLRGRTVMAVAAAIVVFLSAGLTLWREAVSDYTAFSAASVEAGVYARDNTEEDAVFLSGRQHLNPISSIAGRQTVCGPDLWLYYHGFDTSEADDDIRRFFEDPEANLDVLEKYGVDYIYISSYEYAEYDLDEELLCSLFEVVFSNSEATILRVPEG